MPQQRHHQWHHQEDGGLDDWLNKLQDTLENSEISAVDFVEEFKLNLYAKEIFVFTPKGDLFSLSPLKCGLKQLELIQNSLNKSKPFWTHSKFLDRFKYI